MGPVLASPISVYIIWCGHWYQKQQATTRDFIYSLSAPSSYASHPSVADWWRTIWLYTDQTGSNITRDIALSGEFYDFSHGGYLSRLDIQSVIKHSVTASDPHTLPLNPHSGLYLVLTSSDVQVQDFCRAVCGFHYFTFPTIVGVTVPYAWIGYSGTQCPRICAYPFAWPKYLGRPLPRTNGGNDLMKPENGDVGVDGMISVIAHELAEVSSNPLVNAWYAGDDPTVPTEIADLCLGVYGRVGGGGYVGGGEQGLVGSRYNLNGVKGGSAWCSGYGTPSAGDAMVPMLWTEEVDLWRWVHADLKNEFPLPTVDVQRPAWLTETAMPEPNKAALARLVTAAAQ
ncbi:hypothetical protein NL676_002091 [Syzygium grande]|nr:hypothetical protein NL676_002091 [Syzygium grande]